MFLKKHPLVTGIVTVALCGAAVPVLDGDSVKGIYLRILMSVVCGAAAFSISGTKVFEDLDKNIGYVLRWFGGFLIFSAVQGISGLVVQASKGMPLVSGWPKEVCITALYMISVGLFEELCFRVVINDSLLYSFRDHKYIFVWIALVSSLVFGYIHVAAYTFSTPSMVAQGVLKTVSAGITGFALLILYWKTRNFWAIAIAHALLDGLAYIHVAFFGSNSSGNYVAEGTIVADGIAYDQGLVMIIYYSGQFFVNLICALVLIKVLKSIDFEKIRREW